MTSADSTFDPRLKHLPNDIALVGLGSNLGDRKAYLDAAAESLDGHAHCAVLCVSKFVETEPVDSPEGAGQFLNGALLVRTDLDPEGLLRLLHELEADQDRVRLVVNGPRTLDLDLLAFGRVFQDSAQLTLPHPRMHDRLFVLDSVAELCPELELARADQVSVRTRQGFLREKDGN